MADYSGVHTPTTDVPVLFVYPSKEVCKLIADGTSSPKLGCPRCAKEGAPYESCSHGLDSYVCEFAVK